MDRPKLIKRLIFLILLLFVINFFANKLYWYSSIWYFDMIMHFLGGFWIGLLYIYFHNKESVSLRFVFKILLFTFLIGVGWEIFEILVNDVIAQNPFNTLDTFSDLFFDLAGGGISILYFLKRIMLQSKDGPWANSFKDRP